MRPPKSIAFAAAVLSLAWASAMHPASAAPPGKRLILNGNVISYDVRVMDGQASAPLGDIAKAMGMVVVRRWDGSYEIKKPGGTHQVGDLSGKVGDVLFDGKWRLQVLSVSTPDSYRMRTDSLPYNAGSVSNYSGASNTFEHRDGYKLVVLKVRVTNGQHDTQTLWTAMADTKMRTALTDTDGTSHPPIAYDYEGGPNQTPNIIPGASLTFNIIFGVADDVVIKDFIMTLKNNDYEARGNNARVSLK